MENIIIFLVLLVLGYGFGRAAELRHFKSIRLREKALQSIPAIATKIPDPGLRPRHTQLVSGNVVVSVDYFKRFLAGLRNLVGGRVTSYETLLDRARREAVLRMKLEANRLGAKLIFNVKFETSSISKGARNQVGAVEVYAYGTAFID
ncbi:MAG: heavy metal-binding domain-containing protein [Gammaproteobacteria bacterium]|nr:heavy metal-binding domain-containing protein [Gammaproteobacteria bacterium]